MSAYENVVGGKLRLKGKALDVKTGGITKKKKKHSTKKLNHCHEQSTTDHLENINATDKCEKQGQGGKYDDHLTPAEKRYLEQWEKIDLRRVAKMSSKSHRDRIQQFNQYLANIK